MMFIAGEHHPCSLPLSPTLPHKGGENPSADASLTRAKHQNAAVALGEVSTLVGLPPPLWGRVGERGKPRALAGNVTRRNLDEARISVSAR